MTSVSRSVSGNPRPARLPAFSGRLLSHANHGLKQHLHTISLYAGVLETKTSEPAVLELIEGIRRSTSALAQIFDIAAELCRLEAGDMVVEKRPVRAKRILDALKFDVPDARLRCIGSDLAVLTDGHFLDRLLGLLVAAVLDRSTQSRLLVGCRRTRQAVRFEVWVAGSSVSASDLAAARLSGGAGGGSRPDFRLIAAVGIADFLGADLSADVRSERTSRLVVQLARA